MASWKRVNIGSLTTWSSTLHTVNSTDKLKFTEIAKTIAINEYYTIYSVYNNKLLDMKLLIINTTKHANC